MKSHLIKKVVIVLLMYFSVNIHASEAVSSEHRQHEAHVHGEAKLNILIDGTTLVFELKTPALNVLGFEHKPKNEQQKEKLNKANQILAVYENVISIPDLSCEKTQVEIVSPYADSHNNDDHDDDHGHDEEHEHDDDHEHGHDEEHGHDDEHDHDEEHEHHEEGHSEYYLSYSLTCDDINRLEYIEVRLFDNFDGFESIEATWINQTGAGSTEVTKEKRIIRIK